MSWKLKLKSKKIKTILFDKDKIVKISKKPMPLKFDTLYSEDEVIYKEFSNLINRGC